MGSSTRRQGRPWDSVYSTPPWHRARVAKNNPLLATSKVCSLDFSICPVCGSHLCPLTHGSPGKALAPVVPKEASLFNTAQVVGRWLGCRKDSTHPWEPWRHSGSVCLCAATLPSFKATLFTSQSGCRGEGLAHGTLRAGDKRWRREAGLVAEAARSAGIFL